MGRKLNLGCGDHWLPKNDGWDNIDIRDLVPPAGCVFMKHDVRRLRELYKDGVIEEIYASDIIEHMPKPHAIRFLQDMHKLLISGGKLTVRTPCVEYLLEWTRGHTPEECAYRFYGWNDYPENSHCFCWTIQMLKSQLEEIGFSVSGVKRTENTNMFMVCSKN